MNAAIPLRSFRGVATAFLALAALCLPGTVPLAAAASMCAPVGGAPGPWPSLPDSPFGSIGADASPVPGLSPDEWITDLVGGGSGLPPREPCVSGAEPNSGSSEPASLSPRGPGRGAGNPVDLVTGNKYARAVDLLMPDPESGLAAALVEALGADAALALGPAWQSFAPLRLAFTRHYNSRFDAAGPLGPGWRHGFETALARLRTRHGIELQVVQADGRRIVFRPTEAGGSRFDGAEAGTGRIDEQLAGSLPWAWHWPDGRVLRFDRTGRLARIEAPDRDRLVLERSARGQLIAVQDGNGRRLALEYESDRLLALVLPDGQRIRYRYDPHRVLSEVVYPDGRALRYRYEDLQAFHLLTSIERPGRKPTRYRYDEQSRVIETGSGVDGSQPLRLAWFPPRQVGDIGRTEVTEGDRQSSWRWRIDPATGAAELLSVEGRPCSTCPAIAPSAEVAPASPASRASPASSGTSAVGVPPGAESSGVERELQVDAFGLPAQAILSDPADAQRIIHLSWQRHQAGPLAGKLAWVERLAPDGRAARTSFRHDSRRRLVAIELPEGMVETIDRDASGRPVAWRSVGPGRREVGYDAQGRLVSWRVDGQSTRVSWGDDGLPAGIEWPAGDRWRFEWAAGSVAIRSDRDWVAGGEAKAPGGGVSLVKPPHDRGMAVAIAGRGTSEGSGHSAANTSHPSYVVDASGRRTDFLRDVFGRLIEERSAQAGWRRFTHDAWGRVAQVESSDGSTEHRVHDLAGRLLERVQVHGEARVTTRFSWQGRTLVGIEHPQQSTLIEHDPNGQVMAIVDRIGSIAHRWTFARDARGRIVGQGLPDGSLVSYRFDSQGRPVAMHWQASMDAPVLAIVDAVRYAGNVPVGWRYGNGTRFERSNDPGGRPVAWRWLGGDGNGKALLPDWRIRWHANGLPASIDAANERRRFGWDLLGRLIIDERETGAARTAEYFAWDAAGSLLAVGGAGPGLAATRPADAGARNASGQVSAYRGMRLERGVTGRVERVIAPDGGQQADVARYLYNAAGERIRSEVGPGVGGTSARGFLYRSRRLAAETDGAGRLNRHYLRWMGMPVAIIDRGSEVSPGRAGGSLTAPRLAWLHGDHLGTPHAATDSRGRLVWQGRYRAFGRLAEQRGPLRQPLRFDGQYEDPETGLHDNYQRSYDPDSGRYLEPDPMGLVAGLDRHAYADGNPVIATDPLGLILFAFDGTRNAADPPGRDDVSNVRKFFDLYQDQGWYMTGVGLSDPNSKITTNALDAINANTARARVDYMLTELDRYVDAGDRTGDTIDIDVIGFSRGAAMARDFVNHVAMRDTDGRWRDHGVCINLRFLGLWDTVAQFGANGIDNGSWRLAIPSAVGVTYHAVALNEHRTLFPLESAHGMAVIERGFIGSHADIGGGNAEGDLSDVSLVWMFEKARSAGLPLRDPPEAYRRVEAPFLHDRNFDLVGDRQVISRDSTGKVVSSVPQRRARIAGMSWSATQPFLAVAPWRQKDADGKVSIVGDVDIDAYLDWLELNYGLRLEN